MRKVLTHAMKGKDEEDYAYNPDDKSVSQNETVIVILGEGMVS